MSYADFIAAKNLRATDEGITPTQPVNETLFDWQARVVDWSLGKGRAALFEDCGLGKTFQQLEWARLAADTSLILAPLSVARQTIREATKLGIEARYVRHQNEVNGPGVWVTNYEMVDKFDPTRFGAVVLDESSILKNVDGRTRQQITKQWRDTPMRLACTATPAPNDVTELCNHADFLGRMGRAEMLAFFFVNDEMHGKTRWRLKGHASEKFYAWMASWAVGVRTPSDLGSSDDGYVLPPLTVVPHVVDVADVEPDAGQLFATLGGVQGRAKVRRGSMAARVERATDIANSTDDQWIIWCGMNEEAKQCAAGIRGAINVEGSMTPDQKAEGLEAFQDGAVRVLVTKTAIAGFGMNFQNAHRMAFVGMGDSYEAYYQATRRCWRFGQTEPVDVHVIVSELEQEIVRNVQDKEFQASEFTDGLVRHSQLREGAMA